MGNSAIYFFKILVVRWIKIPTWESDYGFHPSLQVLKDKWNGNRHLQRHNDDGMKSRALSQLLSHIRSCRQRASQGMLVEKLQVSSVKLPCILHQILQDFLHIWDSLLLTALRLSLNHILQLLKFSMELEGKEMCVQLK